MDANTVARLKKRLLEQRQESCRCLEDLQAGWQALGERDSEREEEAQKADLSCLFDQLDNRQKAEIEEIDQALARIDAATYGECERCRKPIALERLEALPATALCSACARKLEEGRKGPPPVLS